MDDSNSIAHLIASWLPSLILLVPQLGVTIWLTLKIIKVQEHMVEAQRGILQKMTDTEQRLAQRAGSLS